MDKKRNIGLDLLRILSMLMIVMLHYLLYGGALKTEFGTSTNYIAWILEAFCIVAVNCYIYITGYFSINSKFNMKKVFKLWGQVLFYSISIYLILLATHIINFNVKEAIQSFMPVITKQYWFITVYILLYILSPFLNIMIKNLTKKQFQTLIGILLFVFCICTTFLPGPFVLDASGGYSIMWFVCLYCIGAYIKLYYDDIKNNKSKFLMYLVITLVVILSRLIIAYICNNLGLDLKYSVKFYQYNSITICLSSIFLFLFFKNISINNKIVNKAILLIAPLTLGVYLIHEQLAFRKILYNDILHTQTFLQSNYFVIIALVTVIIEFSIFIFIEYIRSRSAKYIIKTNVYMKFENKIVFLYKNILNKLKIRNKN